MSNADDIRRPEKAILYARVSTEEQARSGYSLAQQLAALRQYAASKGFEILEELEDAGYSGSSLERPGMDRVRDLVASGSVTVVLTQDRDRLAREPAYHYLLREEFGEHGTSLRSLSDRGDDSPEGQLTDGILDQLAKFERAKTTERTRRGKLEKARSGKVVGGHRVNYGFAMNAESNGYEIDELKMANVRRIFSLVGETMVSITSVVRTLNLEGIPGPSGGRWNTKAVRSFVRDDVYKPHTYEEVSELVSPEALSKLESGKSYGIWWFNRERWHQRRVSEPDPAGTGRVYCKKSSIVPRPREEWIPVPVPDAGIPRDTVEAARRIVENNVACSSNGDRTWELSGGIMRCTECGGHMRTVVTRKKDGRRYFYYTCANRRDVRSIACSNGKNYPAERIESEVWAFVSGLLTDPERLRVGLDAMLKRERDVAQEDPKRQAVAWERRVTELNQMRARYQDMAARSLVTLDELGARLEDLDSERETAERELALIRARSERLEDLERDAENLIDSYSKALPEVLGAADSQERSRVYKMLRLRALANSKGEVELEGVLGNDLFDIPGSLPAESSTRITRPANWPLGVRSGSGSSSSEARWRSFSSESAERTAPTTSG